jgi:raffinose/stachyose/melibiose transport system substrate-binding protein
MNRVKLFLSRYLGPLILGGAMVYSLVSVLLNQITYDADDVTTLRICHWQLEAGFRESLQALIDDYEQHYKERTGKQIRILQVPISERAYRQYVNTGLIGDMAPDIIEKGKALTTESPSYVARFFLPLGEYVTAPNPYNADTELDSLPWKDTFFDGMQGAYDQQLLDYYFIPFSMFTVRIYYNAPLFKMITGREHPPETYAEFMQVCAQIEAYAKEHRQPLVPLAASKAQGAYFSFRYETPFRDQLAHRCDMDYDGNATAFETYFGMRRNLWNFHSDALIQSAHCMMDIASYFPTGWLAAERDDALFMFAQQRAIMIASGSWDAQSIIDQTKAHFDIGAFPFPMPVDHPIYGKYVKGPVSEAAARGGIPWAINKKTPYADICIDFLQYCTTRKNNERFNTRITWLPVIRGARLANEKLKAFKPIVHGYAATFDYKISTAVALLSSGNKWSIYAGQMTPKENADALQAMYDRTAEDGYLRKLDELRRNNRNLERVVAAKIALRACLPNRADEMDHKLVQLDQASQAVHHNYYVYQYWFDKLESSPEE